MGPSNLTPLRLSRLRAATTIVTAAAKHETKRIPARPGQGRSGKLTSWSNTTALSAPDASAARHGHADDFFADLTLRKPVAGRRNLSPSDRSVNLNEMILFENSGISKQPPSGRSM